MQMIASQSPSRFRHLFRRHGNFERAGNAHDFDLLVRRARRCQRIERAASSRSVMKLLKRLTTMPKRNPLARRSPRSVFGLSFVGHSLGFQRP